MEVWGLKAEEVRAILMEQNEPGQVPANHLQGCFSPRVHPVDPRVTGPLGISQLTQRMYWKLFINNPPLKCQLKQLNIKGQSVHCFSFFHR